MRVSWIFSKKPQITQANDVMCHMKKEEADNLILRIYHINNTIKYTEIMLVVY